MAIEVQRETKQRLVESIKRYFADEMEEEIGPDWEVGEVSMDPRLPGS